jgi:formate hydrogenlyase transcriptional activator
LLVEHFVRKFSARLDKPIDVIPPEVMEILKKHHWPGNIRELQNCIERAVVLSPGSALRPTLTDLNSVAGQFTTNTAHTLATAAREHTLAVLEQTNWTVGGPEGAAARLGLPRTTLLYKMRKLGIEPRRTQSCRFVSTRSVSAVGA